MWFIWIMWVIVAIAIIATIILLTGKGSMLVSGFNTKSPEERAKYDKEKVSKQTGLLMIFVDVGLLALTSYIQFRAIPAIQNNTISDYGTEITIVALGICAYIIFTIIGVARGEAGMPTITQVTETPGRAHARRQRAQTNARRLVSYIQADAAHGISNDNLHHLFAVLAFSVDYNVFRYREISKKFPPQAAEIKDLC